MNRDWQVLLEALNEYSRNSFNLPSDNSLISPVARVILQKRRLLKIQEIHNILLEVSCEPHESLVQGEHEKEFLLKFRSTFVNVHWNEFSACEAQALSVLIVDTLHRCQADVNLINMYIKEAAAEIQGPDFKTRTSALRSALILIRNIFRVFPKQSGPWANDLLKAVLLNFKYPNIYVNCFDCVLESLKCLQIILRLPLKFVDVSEREKILPAISKYLKANSTFIAIESAKVMEAYYENSGKLTKKDVKNILEQLNGGLSFRLQEYKCSPKLLEFCFEIESEKGILDNVVIGKNIERIRTFKYLDTRLFSDALANVLNRWNEKEAANLLFLLLPFKGSKSFVSSKCFSRTIELTVERCSSYSDSIKMIRFVFDKILLEQLQDFPDDYCIELIEVMSKLYKKFPESLNETDFESFSPLSRPNEILQIKSVELISIVLQDRPIILSTQLTLIFAQLKGDFLRLKLEEQSVIRDAVVGLLKLFAKVLMISLQSFSNYCDHDTIEKVIDWTLSQFKINEETEWLRSDREIVNGLLLISSVFCVNRKDNFEIICGVVEFANQTGSIHVNSLLEFFTVIVTHEPDHYKLLFGSIEKCFHELSSHGNYGIFPTLGKLVPIMKLIVDNKNSEYNSVPAVTLIAKIISAVGYSDETNDSFSFKQMTEYYAKMFWRSTDHTQDFCLTLWTSSLKNKTAAVPSQIIQIIRALLESTEIKILDSDHQSLLINEIQEIVKEFLLDDMFDVRLECGIVLGSLVRLFDSNDEDAVNDLFEQFMKHAMRSGSKDQKSRVCYIMGLVVLKSNTENSKIIKLNSSTLIGLIASWNRESNFDSKSDEREIAAASIFSLAYYIEKCGCSVNASFYRDSCELLLEQVLMRDRCEVMVRSVKELAKSLSLYVNLMPCQSQFITMTTRMLLESSYLSYYGNDCIELLLEISEFNPQITTPSELIFANLKRNIAYHSRGSFGMICQYLNLQISFDDQIALRLIDSGLLILILERANNPEGFNESEYEILSFLLQKIINLTLMERFDFWYGSVFERLNLSGGDRVSFKAPKVGEVSNSEFSLTDLREVLKPSINLRPQTVLMILGPLSQNLSKLIDLQLDDLKKFLVFAIKICVNVSAEKSAERSFYLAGISLFRGLIRTFSTIKTADDVSILEPFDSQIISIISSSLRHSEDGDPFFAACAFGSLFSLISCRSDLCEDLKTGNGRISNLVNKAMVTLKEQEVLWNVEMVENLVILSIIIGLCSLSQSDFDLNILDPEIMKILLGKIEDCFSSYSQGTLEKNVRLSLSGSDRILLIKTWLKNISDDGISDDISDPQVIGGIVSLLTGLNSDKMEVVCEISESLFKLKSISSISKLGINQLLKQISAFGIEKKEPLAVYSILPLLETCFGNEASEALNNLSIEFISSRFGDFDAQFGLAVLKAQDLMISKSSDNQDLLFEILKKLVESCLNDLEVNNSKDMLKGLKSILSNPEISVDKASDLISEWIDRLEEIDSVFLNQLVFFSVSSCPQIWTDVTYKGLRRHFEKLLKSVNTVEMALDSWILLLKAQSKSPNSEIFANFVAGLTGMVSDSFEKYRGDGIDLVWERIFGIAQTICNNASSENLMLKVSELSAKALEELNDFK